MASAFNLMPPPRAKQRQTVLQEGGLKRRGERPPSLVLLLQSSEGGDSSEDDFRVENVETEDISDQTFFDFPRDAISLIYLSYGMVFTFVNIAGMYDHYDKVILASLLLGTASTGALIADAIDPPPMPVDATSGYVTRRNITRFGASYMAAVMWVCFRTSPFFPIVFDINGIALDPVLRSVDAGLNVAAAAVFVFGVASPLSDLLWGGVAKTDTQKMLLNGSIVQNIIGATFLPVVLTMAARGPLWWDKVHELWPAQMLLEPSTSTFAALSVESGLLFLRLAARDKVTWPEVVTWGVGSCVIFAIIPCACFLRYNDGSFDWFSLYSIPMTW
jgi:hypothetical protein